MPSLEQIIRPFVVDPTTPPVPVVTTLNKPPPEPVRLNIGIGGTRPQDLGSKVAPILPPKPLPPGAPPAGSLKPKITMKTLSSSHSLAASWYMTGVVREKTTDDSGGASGGPSGGGGGGSQGGAGTKDNKTVTYLDITFPAGSELGAQFLGQPGGKPAAPPQPDSAPAGNPPAPSAGGPVGGSGGSP